MRPVCSRWMMHSHAEQPVRSHLVFNLHGKRCNHATASRLLCGLSLAHLEDSSQLIPSCLQGALVVSLILGESGYEAVITLAGAEITQPFLQTRWYLRELGMYNNNTFAWINDTIFLLTFTFMRYTACSSLLFYNTASHLFVHVSIS